MNRSLAALSLMGKAAVETPGDALELARELGADATLVAAITEYSPYDPPVVGLILQWYPVDRGSGGAARFDPVTASRQATEVVPAEYAEEADLAPMLQVQRVYNAADNALRKDIREYARHRQGFDSSLGWQRHVQSQELFLRYSCWASIETMLLARDAHRAGPNADETDQWNQDGDA